MVQRAREALKGLIASAESFPAPDTPMTRHASYMYVCMYVCMYICGHIYTCIYTCSLPAPLLVTSYCTPSRSTMCFLSSARIVATLTRCFPGGPDHAADRGGWLE